MTVLNTDARVMYEGNGSATEFDITFPYLNDSGNLKVYHRSATGVQTLLTEGTDYSVDTSADTVTYPLSGDALPSGEHLLILRDIATTQELDLVNNDPFDANLLEAALDQLTMLAQQHEAKIIRAPKFPVSVDFSKFDTTMPSPKAERLLGIASDGVHITLYETGTEVAAHPAIDHISNHGDDLKQAMDDIGAVETTLIINKALDLGGDSVTVPENVELWYTRAGEIDNGTLTVNGYEKKGPWDVYGPSLTVNKSGQPDKTRTLTSATTLTKNDHGKTILLDYSGGSFPVTLPSHSDGLRFPFVVIDASNSGDINDNGGTFQHTMDSLNQTVTLISDGSQWLKAQRASDQDTAVTDNVNFNQISEQGNRVGPIKSEHFHPYGDFHLSEEICCQRIGNLVILSSDGDLSQNLTTSNPGNGSDSAYRIPSDYRPSNTVYSTIYAKDHISTVQIDSGGSLQVHHIDFSGDYTTKDKVYAFTIAYVITGNFDL